MGAENGTYCNDVQQNVDIMNKTSVGATLRSPILTPKLLQFKGVIPALDASTFFFKRDSQGISAAGAAPLEAGGISFTVPTGYTIGAVNTWLVQYALVIREFNVQNTDATQVANSPQNQFLTLDGDHTQQTNWVPAFQSMMAQNQNLINDGQALILTSQSFFKYPIASDPLVPITVLLTFKKITSVPYCNLDAYLAAAGISSSPGSM